MTQDNMHPTDYIPELLYSKVPVAAQGMEEYLRRLEQMRQEYLWSIVSISNPNVVRASIMEMERVKGEIESRGEIKRMIRESLVKSVSDTINYLGCMVDNKPTIAVDVRETSDEDGRKTISGIRELADYVGCGNSTAFAIVKSGVLKANGVQYKVGKKWVFNKIGLNSLLETHPEILGKVRCQH